MRALETAGVAGDRYLWAQRVFALGLFILGLMQVALQLTVGHDHILAIIGALQVLCGAALGFVSWLRAP